MCGHWNCIDVQRPPLELFIIYFQDFIKRIVSKPKIIRDIAEKATNKAVIYLQYLYQWIF